MVPPEGPPLSPVPALRDEPPAGLHLHIQASFHGAHLHVFVQVAVHVALGRGQFQLSRTERQEQIGFLLVSFNRLSPTQHQRLTSIWSMVSWYSFSLDLNRDSVSLITFSIDSSCREREKNTLNSFSVSRRLSVVFYRKLYYRVSKHFPSG